MKIVDLLVLPSFKTVFVNVRGAAFERCHRVCANSIIVTSIYYDISYNCSRCGVFHRFCLYFCNMLVLFMFGIC